jgi:hypothetical protein
MSTSENILRDLIHKIDHMEQSEDKQLAILNQRIRSQTVSLISTALILVCAFIWKDIVEGILVTKLQFTQRSTTIKVGIATAFTIMCIVVIYLVTKYIEYSDMNRNGNNHNRNNKRK